VVASNFRLAGKVWARSGKIAENCIDPGFRAETGQG